MRTTHTKGPATSVARTSIRRASRLLLLTGALTIPACTNNKPQRVEVEPPTTDQLATVPEDFTLDLRILTPHTRSGIKPTSTETNVSSHIQPARILLFPGGLLHAETNGVHQATYLPPLVRRLNTRQIAETWSLLRQLGFAAPQSADTYINPRLIDYPAQGARYVLNLRAGHERWMYHRDVEPNAENPALQRLATYLSELAWLSPETAATMTIAPRNYDFGSDPYARYRENSHP